MGERAPVGQSKISDREFLGRPKAKGGVTAKWRRREGHRGEQKNKGKARSRWLRHIIPTRRVNKEGDSGQGRREGPVAGTAVLTRKKSLRKRERRKGFPAPSRS